MVFVVPAGHPFVTVASKNNNLNIVCFEVNAQRNKKLAFAGNFLHILLYIHVDLMFDDDYTCNIIIN
jgi:hypothetical protein